MIRHETRIWVNYSDTDQMGFVHHSNYVKYYENARWDAFRCLGLPYSKIEESDILMPVVEMDMKFLLPAFYDDELVIKTSIERESLSSMTFFSEIYNSENKLINKARVKTAFVSKDSKKPCRPPMELLSKLNGYFASKAPISGGKVLTF